MKTAATIIDRRLLDQLSAQAADSGRLRKNHNFHTPAEETANRLLNAIEPGSYVQPHRHNHPTKDESIVVLRGRFGFVFFDELGNVQQTVAAAPGTAVVGVDIPHGSYHSVVSLEPGSVFFEAKAGPFEPLDDDERAPWAPREGDPEADAYRTHLEQLFR